MSTFEVKIYPILSLDPIPGADVIELATIMGYQSVVKKGDFTAGQMVIYIPEQAIVPEWILEHMGLVGKLAGSSHNRVKAIHLRGVLSQGLVLPFDSYGDNDHTEYHLKTAHRTILLTGGSPTWGWDYGVSINLAEKLGITKWEPTIPAELDGEFFYTGSTNIFPVFDIENFKNHPDVIKDGEEVVMEEKIHGTFTVIAYQTESDERAFGEHWYISSKGMSAKGFALCDTDNNREHNTYVSVALKLDLFNQFEKAAKQCGINGNFCVMGETFGDGVQDLTYGLKSGDRSFRGFGVFIGEANTPNGRYLDDHEKDAFFKAAMIERATVLYRGPFSKEIMLTHTNGKETISDTCCNIREGVVITPVRERRDMSIGRVILKSVSDAYLCRKNATEYN